MRSHWKGIYVSSDIILKILRIKKKYRKKFFRGKKVKYNRSDFRIHLKNRGIRSSTIISEMSPFTFELPNGVLGHVTVKVKKKNKEMNKIKKLKILRPNDKVVGLKLGEFAFTRNFEKHVTKNKK